MLLAAPAGAQPIRIENGGEVEFYYSVRYREGQAWSKTFELEPGRTHTLQGTGPVVISYWTDLSRFATLEPGQSYRIDDPRSGPLRPVTATLRPSIDRPTPADSANPSVPSGDAVTPGKERSAPEDVRVLRVAAMADSTYRQVVDDWRQRIRDTVAGASKYYEANFRIRLELDKEIRSWEYQGLIDSVEARLKQALLISPGEADLLAAFVGFGEFYRTDEEAFLTGHLGLGVPFGRHLLVTGNDDYHVNREITVLIHELGHVFGAFHVTDPRSPMQPGYDDAPIREIIRDQLLMDAVSSEIIRLTRQVDFRLGVASLDPATCRRIRELAQQHRHPTEIYAASPIARAHVFDKLRRDARLEADLAGSQNQTGAAPGVNAEDRVRVTAASTEITADGYTLAVVPKDATLRVLHVANDRLHVAWESGVLQGWVRTEQLISRFRAAEFRENQALYTAAEADVFNGEHLLTTLPRGVRVTVERVQEPFVLVRVEKQDLDQHKAARLIFEPVIEGWVPRESVTKIAPTPAEAGS